VSALIVAKILDQVVLATDSRLMNRNFSEVSTDSEQKILEIGKNACFAASGWKYACEWQGRLAQELGWAMSNIRQLACALDAILQPRLKKLAEILTALRSAQ